MGKNTVELTDRQLETLLQLVCDELEKKRFLATVEIREDMPQEQVETVAEAERKLGELTRLQDQLEKAEANGYVSVE